MPRGRGLLSTPVESTVRTNLLDVTRGLVMKKSYLCKLCLIVFGALLAVQNVNASPYKKLWESVSGGVTEMVSGFY